MSVVVWMMTVGFGPRRFRVLRASVVAIVARVTLILVTLSGSSCGYSLAGRGSFLPDYIKTIGVPTFDNRTTLFNLETQVTEKVRSEFIGRGLTRSSRMPRTWTRC